LAAAPPVDGPNALVQNLDVCIVARWRAAQGDFSGTEAASRRLRSATLYGVTGYNPTAYLQIFSLCAALLDAERASRLALPDATARLMLADSLSRTFPLFEDADQDANLVLARLWEAQGDLPRARAANRRRAGVYADWPPFLSTFLREEGRLAAIAGDTAGAVRAYRHYLMFRYDPEPSVQLEVERVRRDLATLLRQR
jgi:hypothetical protein